jgi:hypothetical protein
VQPQQHAGRAGHGAAGAAAFRHCGPAVR